MRFVLLLALVIAVAAVVFALQNPADIPVRLGPYVVTGSTAIVLLVTFAFGALTGILAAAPGRWRASRRAKLLEKQMNSVATPASVVATPAKPAALSPTPAPKKTPPGDVDPYTARFGPPPNQV